MEKIKRINFFIAVTSFLVISILDVLFILKIGHVESGNPGLWFIVGGLQELDFINKLPNIYQFFILYPTKIAGDFLIILISSIFAVKIFDSKKEELINWVKGYSILGVLLDSIFLIISLPVLVNGAFGKYLLSTNLFLYPIYGANMIFFTKIYQETFKLTSKQAIKGFFIFTIAIPTTIAAILILIFK